MDDTLLVFVEITTRGHLVIVIITLTRVLKYSWVRPCPTLISALILITDNCLPQTLWQRSLDTVLSWCIFPSKFAVNHITTNHLTHNESVTPGAHECLGLWGRSVIQLV